MRTTNREVPPGTPNFRSVQQRKRKRTANTDESENTQTRSSTMNNTSTSVPLSKADENALPKRVKNRGYKFTSQESNQTTVNNIMGGSDSITATGKRKISTTIDVDDSTPSSYSGNQNSSKRRNLSDITNICPTVSNLQSNLQTPFTSGGCVSKISTNALSDKGKVVARDNKIKSNTRTNSCRKTLNHNLLVV
ncbi:unnamed protein product [Brassica rapa]|uniref:Uncharacterized protein n=1 Tax=Brassica campestris TaxID=3711 RepID=A0A3P6A5G5_BRACM|nr:unnamed protein product [Brassica rapa]VDC82463.1 unnamed protein product [Brassica rapa]